MVNEALILQAYIRGCFRFGGTPEQVRMALEQDHPWLEAHEVHALMAQYKRKRDKEIN